MSAQPVEHSKQARGTVIYESELAQVHCADAWDVVSELPTESVGLVIADPPYGVEWRSGRRAVPFDRLTDDDREASTRDAIRNVLAECVRVVAQNRHLYVFGPTDVLDGLKVAAPVQLVWDKTVLGMGDLVARWGSAHESVTFAVSKHRHGGEAGGGSLPARLRKGSVLRAPRPTGRKVRHPSEKPVALLREFIESSSRAGENVLDPFAGSGSTGVAAILAGRRALLIEVDRQWADLTVERVRAAEAVAARMVAL